MSTGKVPQMLQSDMEVGSVFFNNIWVNECYMFFRCCMGFGVVLWKTITKSWFKSFCKQNEDTFRGGLGKIKHESYEKGKKFGFEWL